ncbi:hypothetical protein EDD22DRAFT_919724 [Suillus occidentalis]|nr:hypothetical protein EDD22DRAFT_919724 [Suillus occidentalis]
MQASTIATIPIPTSSPQATSLISSSPIPQPTSSVDASTTSSDVTTSSQLELTSSLLVSSTSSETSSSIPTSQSTFSTSSVSSSSHTPTSTSTSAPTTTATATTPSSSPSPSSISQNNLAPTSPTSTNDGLTTSTITSFFVTVIGSSSITSTTLIPTVISSSSATTTGATDRTAVIAGSVIGGGLLIILVLSVFFYRQRQRFKQFHFLDAINVRRRQARVRATLLAGEDLEDVDLARPPPGRYSDYDSPWDSRDSSGSLNDTERGNLMSPLHGGDIDLSHIVDDVMGPSAPGVHYSQNSLLSFYHDLPGHESAPQTREVSNASQIALIEAAGLSNAGSPSMQQPTRSSPLGNNDPAVSGGGHAP